MPNHHPTPQRPTRTYRCRYMPSDTAGRTQSNEQGVYPFVQLKACSATHALEQAHAVTGCTVIEAERMEGGAA